MPPVVIAAGIVGVGAIAGGAIASGGASRAARTQAEASTEAGRTIEAAGREAAAGLAPWEAAGVPALEQYQAQLGLGDAEGVDLPPGILAPGDLTLPDTDIAQDFETSPGYEFRREEALRGIEQSAATRGLLRSGQNIGDIARYSSGLASEEYGQYYAREQARYGREAGQYGQQLDLYNQYMGRLAGLSDMGYSAAVAGANVRIGTAGQVASSNVQAASAIAAGQRGSAAAWGGALAGLGQAAGTAVGYYGNQPTTPAPAAPPPSSGYGAGYSPYGGY